MEGLNQLCHRLKNFLTFRAVLLKVQLVRELLDGLLQLLLFIIFALKKAPVDFFKGIGQLVVDCDQLVQGFLQSHIFFP